MNKRKVAVMRRLAELAMGEHMKDQIKRWGPLLAGALLVVAGALRLIGEVSHANAIEQMIAWSGFQSDISPGEVGVLLALASGLALKGRALWLKAQGRAPMKPPVLQTEAQMNLFVDRYQTLLASMPWDEARKLALATVLRTNPVRH